MRCDLTTTHRFRKDKQHGINIARMRSTESTQPVSESFLDSLQQMSAQEMQDPLYRFATVGVVSNLERSFLNAARSADYAKWHKRVLIRWRLQLSGSDAATLNKDELDELFQDEVGLWFHFVAGAPCVLTDTSYAQHKGLVNGTRAIFHSLTLADDATDDLASLIANATPGEVITLSQAPATVNVVPNVAEHFERRLRPDSLDASELVIPIAWKGSTDEYEPTSTFAAMNSIGLKRHTKGSRKRSTHLFVKSHAVESAFAVTDFKMQGKSEDIFVLSLAPRPFGPPFDLSAVYVLASRVRTRMGMRVLKMGNWDHLRALRHVPELEIWENSYDKLTGRFDARLAEKAAEVAYARYQAEVEAAKEAARAAKAAGRSNGGRRKQQTQKRKQQPAPASRMAAGPSSKGPAAAAKAFVDRAKAKGVGRLVDAGATKQVPKPAVAAKPPNAARAQQGIGVRWCVTPRGHFTLPPEVMAAPQKLYLFGENDVDFGTKKAQHSTQAVIRPCPNAHPVRTCYGPGAGYRDSTYDANVAKIRSDLDAAVAKVLGGHYSVLVIPHAGVGTGVANLEQGAPRTYAFLSAQMEAVRALLGVAAAGATAMTRRASMTGVAAAGRAVGATATVTFPALVGVKYYANSCHTDATAKAIHLAAIAWSELTGQRMEEIPLCPAASVTATDSGLPVIADIGSALRAWLRTVKQATGLSAVTPLEAELRTLDRQRDEVRAQLSRELKVRDVVSRANRRITESIFSSYVRAQSKEMATAYLNLQLMTTMRDRFEHEMFGTQSPARPAFLGGNDSLRYCAGCAHSWETGMFHDRRVHPVADEDLEYTDGDLLRAFALKYGADKPLLRTVSSTASCPQCGGFNLHRRTWLQQGRLAADAPPLLALYWDPGTWVSCSITLDADRRDAAVLAPDRGTFQLIALIYYNGAHYITVGRCDGSGGVTNSSDWVCWDGMYGRFGNSRADAGAGQLLASPPAMRRGDAVEPAILESRSGRCWMGYTPTVAIYAHKRS